MALRPLNAIALCAGGGGLELALRIAEPRYRCVCFVEQEARAAATLVARMADQALDQAPAWDDLKSFDGHPWRGVVDLLSAGYPCQPFSSSGRRRGTEDPRHLWPYVKRTIEQCLPRRVFLENVVGHLHLGFDVVARDLQGMGFRVAAGVFSAREVGAAHHRRRLFILADANSHTDVDPTGDRGGRDTPFREENQPVSTGAGCSLVDPAVGLSDGKRLPQSRLPIFAPGPGDFDAWGALLRALPRAKPALRRDDDGMADWLDRSNLVGNGVCSLAAAYAYRTLSTALSR
ncbi:MAG: DNA cytosine methyltransferase [Magnetospirillum sp.]